MRDELLKKFPDITKKETFMRKYSYKEWKCSSIIAYELKLGRQYVVNLLRFGEEGIITWLLPELNPVNGLSDKELISLISKKFITLMEERYERGRMA